MWFGNWVGFGFGEGDVVYGVGVDLLVFFLW